MNKEFITLYCFIAPLYFLYFSSLTRYILSSHVKKRVYFNILLITLVSISIGKFLDMNREFFKLADFSVQILLAVTLLCIYLSTNFNNQKLLHCVYTMTLMFGFLIGNA